MTDAEMAKESEPAAAEKRSEPEVATDVAVEPDAKKAKVVEPDAAAIRKQVEYYLSDENLRHDKFFHEKITSDPEGWLEVSLILSCKKMKAMRATKEDVISALEESKIEVKDGQTHFRRPGNAPLPALEARPMHAKKSQTNFHHGGYIGVFSGVPAEVSWAQIKEKALEKLSGKGKVWHVGEVTDAGKCFMCISPFEGDTEVVADFTVEVAGAHLKLDTTISEEMTKYSKLLPRHIREKREKEARKKSKDKNRAFAIGSQRFANINALRSKVKEILGSRSDGEALKDAGGDYKLIAGLLSFHPKGEEKTKGMTGLKVAMSSHGENKCFWIVREGGEDEDVSMKKCIDAVEANPPYVESEVKTAKSDPASPKADAKPVEVAKPVGEAKTEEPKIEEAKPTEVAKVDDSKFSEADGSRPTEPEVANTEGTKPAEDDKAAS